MNAQHFRRVRVHRNLPFLREQHAAFFVDVAAGGKSAVRVGGYRAGMGAGFFPKAVFLKQAGYAPKPDNGRADFIHKLNYRHFFGKAQGRMRSKKNT
jgi:hypothetical protein